MENQSTNLIGIIVAMQEEAQPLIDRLKLECVETGLYRGTLPGGDSVVLAITGIGKCNAQNCAWMLLSIGCERIVNMGTCGDCGNHEPGSIVIPTIFYDGDFDLAALGNPTKDPVNVNYRYIATGKRLLPKIVEECYTYSTFVMDKRAEGAIVEMEAYGILAACTAVGAPFIAIKLISDSADENAADSFSEEVEKNGFSSVVEKNVEQIIDIIDHYDQSYAKIYQIGEVKDEK